MSDSMRLVVCSPSGSSVHGISQARILESVVIPFSKGIVPAQASNLGLLCCRQSAAIACGLHVDSLLTEPPGKMQSKISWLSSGWDFAFQCRGVGLISGRGARIPHAL